MSARNAVAIVLLVFVGASVAYILVGGAKGEPSEATPRPASDFVVYYFHGDERCDACRRIETYSKAAIESGFAPALAAGTLSWAAANIDDPRNRGTVDELNLASGGVVVVDNRGEPPRRSKNLTKVWELNDDQPALAAYVVRETKTFLER